MTDAPRWTYDPSQDSWWTMHDGALYVAGGWFMDSFRWLLDSDRLSDDTGQIPREWPVYQTITALSTLRDGPTPMNLFVAIDGSRYSEVGGVNFAATEIDVHADALQREDPLP